MTKNKQFILGLAVLLSTVVHSLSAQTLKNIKLDNKQSILNDKAFFNFPTDAKNEARETDIMAADHNINKETRIVLDIENKKLVFFAQELYLFADKNLFDIVSKEKDDLNFNRKILTDKDQLLSILSTPTVFDSTQAAILVNTLLVKTQDNSIFVISAYINPEAFSIKNEYIQLTEQVFQTLSKGTRVSNLKARDETLSIFGTKKSFRFSLPQNYTITIDQKYDFQVFQFHKYVNYTDINWVNLIMYMGDHPSYFYREFELGESAAKKVKGKFLDKEVSWLSFYVAEKNTYLKEQQVPVDELQKGLIVHIAMLGNTDVSVAELTKIIESIQLK